MRTPHFEVTYHRGARPTHQPWQGRVYTKEELVSVCGYGAVDGLKGANCYHDFHPFFEGVSKRLYSDEELDRMNAEESTPKEYGGRQYTVYEALQRQRRLETSLLKKREEIALLEKGGADKSDVLAAKTKHHALSDEYAQFSKAMDLPQQRERVSIDGRKGVDVSFGESLETGEKPVAKSENSGIIKVNNMKADKNSRIINSIEQPIEQRNTAKGNPNAVLTFGAELNNRQKKLLEQLPEYDSRFTVPKKSVKMSDLAALTALQVLNLQCLPKAEKG